MKNKGLPVVLLGLLAAVQAVAQQGPVVLDRIVAKVDNRYILRSDIEQSFYQYQEEAKARKTTAPTRCQILNSLIINKVMLAKAEIDSVVVDDRRIESELQGRMDQMLQMYGSEKSLVEQFGKSVEQLKAELRPDIQDQLLVDEMRSKITNNVSVTPGEVRKFFNSIPKDSLPYFPSEVEIGQIVRLATVTREEMTALKTRLLDYKKRSLAGEDFGELAKAYSEDAGSAQNGGLYANYKRGSMVPEFEGTLFRLKPGEISDPVETDFGVHIIKLENLQGEVYTVRHILLRPDYARLDLTEPTHQLDSVRTLLLEGRVKFEKLAKDFSQDKLTADTGGWLQDQENRSVRMPMDGSMDPSLYFTLDTMSVGDVTRPLPYRTLDEKTGVRILYYKTRHEPHQANLNDDYLRLQRIALARKRNTAVDTWFNKAKSEVLIQIFDDTLKQECSELLASYQP